MTLELSEFNPPADIEFNTFLAEVRNRAVSTHIYILIEGSIIRFIAKMHEQGLDKDLTVSFSHGTYYRDCMNRPTLELSMKAHGEHKATFVLVLSRDKKRVRNFHEKS